MKDLLYNIRIRDEQVLIPPHVLKERFPITPEEQEMIAGYRNTVADIITRKDHRLLIVCGPCSIHDTRAALDYGIRLKALADKYKDTLYIVMRVYFEKPRTTVGWKGLINDPDMDGSFDVEKGLHIARQLLVDLTRLGLPLASEALDPHSPQYLGDLFSWSAIGARTTESQTHREMASGLSVPVGFKNGTDGDVKMAINAIKSASMPHRFMGINQLGQVCLLQTDGNPHGHMILRGGKEPNYDRGSVDACAENMVKAGLEPAVMIDCSHGNSAKDYRRQPYVVDSVIKQIEEGNKSIMGIMIESNINAGNQSCELCRENMQYGVSVTDACIDFNDTEKIMEKLHSRLKDILLARLADDGRA